MSELNLTVNGEARTLAAGATLADFIVLMGLRSERVAVDLNQAVVRRALWADTVLQEGDKLEIVHFVGGG